MAEDKLKTAEIAVGKSFNFNQDPMLMDPRTYGAYYALRYEALSVWPIREDVLPDGKTMSEEEVGMIIGPEKAKALGMAVTPAMKEPVKKSAADEKG